VEYYSIILEAMVMFMGKDGLNLFLGMKGCCLITQPCKFAMGAMVYWPVAIGLSRNIIYGKRTL
jgi:hypothetical protein